MTEKLLLYANPTEVIRTTFGETSYTTTEGTQDAGYVISFVEGDTVYVAADYVKLFTNYSYDCYDRHVQVYTEWGTRQVAQLKKDTAVRLRGGVKSPILTQAAKGDTLEILEQLGWRTPDYIALSVGDGCTIAGAWKGLKDLYAAGFIERLPRLISVQAQGCCPLNRAIQTGTPWTPMAENTLADSIAVGVPRNPDKALNAIRESDGIAVNVSDDEILAAMRLLGRTQGVFGEPAGVTGTAGVKKALELGLISPDSTVVSIVTGNGLKDVQNGIRAAGEPMLVRPELDALLDAFASHGIAP